MSDDDNADANALQNGAVAAAFPPRMERGASSINVRDFHPDQDDFEQWVKLFEKAVKMATMCETTPLSSTSTWSGFP